MAEDWRPQDPMLVSNALESLMETTHQIKKDLKCPDKYIAKLLRRLADSLDEKPLQDKDYEDDPRLDFYA